MTEVEDVMQEVLSNTKFRAPLRNGTNVLACAGGKMPQHRLSSIARGGVGLKMLL